MLKYRLSICTDKRSAGCSRTGSAEVQIYINSSLSATHDEHFGSQVQGASGTHCSTPNDFPSSAHFRSPKSLPKRFTGRSSTMVDRESEIRAGMDITIDLSASTHNARRKNNALTFVGLCTTQDWNVPVPDLIRLLAQALSSKTDSSVLSASQVWEELSSDKSDLTDQLNLAWWAHPGGGKGCFTFDELNEAFEQYLQKVCHRIDFCRGSYYYCAQCRFLKAWQKPNNWAIRGLTAKGNSKMKSLHLFLPSKTPERKIERKFRTIRRLYMRRPFLARNTRQVEWYLVGHSLSRMLLSSTVRVGVMLCQMW